MEAQKFCEGRVLPSGHEILLPKGTFPILPLDNVLPFEFASLSRPALRTIGENALANFCPLYRFKFRLPVPKVLGTCWLSMGVGS